MMTMMLMTILLMRMMVIQTMMAMGGGEYDHSQDDLHDDLKSDRGPAILLSSVRCETTKADEYDYRCFEKINLGIRGVSICSSVSVATRGQDPRHCHGNASNRHTGPAENKTTAKEDGI